jgi:hypothetical protein
MADRTITITVSGRNVQVSNPSQHVDPDDTLKFKCAAGEFAVLFDNDRSPYSSGKKAHAAHKGSATTKLKIRHLTASEKVTPGAEKFPYGVAVLEPGTKSVLTLDPDIIIDDGGGGGNG